MSSYGRKLSASQRVIKTEQLWPFDPNNIVSGGIETNGGDGEAVLLPKVVGFKHLYSSGRVAFSLINTDFVSK